MNKSMNIFRFPKCFLGTFISANNLVRKKNTQWKADVIVPGSEIVCGVAGDNTERKT